MFGNIIDNKSKIYERDWSKFDREFYSNLFFWKLLKTDLLKIDELNVDNSTKMYLDKIDILLDITHLIKELINTNWNLSG